MAGEAEGAIPAPVSVPPEAARELSADRAASVAAAERSTAADADDDEPEPGEAPRSSSEENAAAAIAAAPVLTPKTVETGLRVIMNPLFRRAKVAPLDQDELRAGGEALAPALNRYLPWLLTYHGELVIAAMWAGGVVLLRLPEKPTAPPAPPTPEKKS